MHKLVLLRHGESVWNRENRFTGWSDVDLTEQGMAEARQAGRLLKQAGFDFDIAYTSVLNRAIHTLWGALEEMDRLRLPVECSWRLNERHYGALQGLNKAETAAKYGDAQVQAWRRSYDEPPPPMSLEEAHSILTDPRYADLDAASVPRAECLKDTAERFMPYWDDTIAPSIRAGRRVMIVAHGNSLRALIKHLNGMLDADIVNLNIPNGVPLVYELDENLQPLRQYYLGDAPSVEQEVAVAARHDAGVCHTMRGKLVVGNWKMHGSLAQCRESIPLLAAAVRPEAGLALCPPAPYLGEIAALASASGLKVGAQDVSALNSGARTGEWSATMLADLGCRYAIVGHSERRQYHGETNALVAAKAQACIEAGITPIVCVGETGLERQAGQTAAVLMSQLAALLTIPGWRDTVIAYEPVWAIGTGLAATPEMAQAAHALLRAELAKADPVAATRLLLLYGGSVKPDNAAELFSMADIDGGLIGGASLEADSLLAIYGAV